MFFVGCASSKTSIENLQYGSSNSPQGGSLVERITSQLQSSSSASSREYLLGFGDRLEMLVYQAEDLSREYQVNSKGQIQVPIVGAIQVAGLTIDQAQDKVKEGLGSSFMINPQVTLSITEYASNEISVTGAVKQPNLYKVKEGRNPFEMLTMAGGLNENAGRFLTVTTRAINKETAQLETIRLVIDIEQYINPVTDEDLRRQREIRELILKDGDNLFVPEAGLVYIDGAVKKPGSYKIGSDTTIFSLIAEAGGAKWSSSSSKAQVIRKVNGASVVRDISLSRIKSGKDPDFKLESGDLIVIGHNVIKRGIEGFFNYGLRLGFLF